MINLKNIKSLLLAGVMAATAFSCTNLDEEIYSQVIAFTYLGECARGKKDQYCGD